MSEEVEGTENITRVSVKDDVLIEGLPVWRVEEAVPIINSRIMIYIHQFGCYIDVPVVQQKGQGAYYVREWTKLNKGCLELITWWIEQGKEFYEDYHIAENIFDTYRQTKAISSGSFAGRISELRGLGLLYPSENKKDVFKLDWSRAKGLIERGGKLKQ